MWKSCRVSTSSLILLAKRNNFRGTKKFLIARFWDKILIQWKHYSFQNYFLALVMTTKLTKIKNKTRLIFWIRNNGIKLDLLTLQGLYYRQWYSDRHEGHWENTPTLCRPFSCLLHIQRQWGKYNESSLTYTNQNKCSLLINIWD